MIILLAEEAEKARGEESAISQPRFVGCGDILNLRLTRANELTAKRLGVAFARCEQPHLVHHVTQL